MEQLFASAAASISELKKNPTQVINSAHGEPVAILNHNSPTAYLVPAKTFELIMDVLDDLDLSELIAKRLEEPFEPVMVDINDL